MGFLNNWIMTSLFEGFNYGRFKIIYVCHTSNDQTFFKIGILKNFAIPTGKYLCWSLFNKVAGFRLDVNGSFDDN